MENNMGIVTIVKEIKEIHPKYIALIRVGNFYRAYGKDAYIISNLFNYKITKEENVDVVGFPKKVIKKVQAQVMLTSGFAMRTRT